jgi:hypothetical protein
MRNTLYGLAAIIFGITALLWHGFNVWQPDGGIHASVLRQILLYVTAFAQIAGGIALQRRETARAGAGILLGVYVLFAVLHLPGVFAHPLVYAYWGGLFEQLALVAAALILFDSTALASTGIALFTLCVVSFMLYQAFYIPATASLVPRWIPPGQTFWAVATTVAFGLAAIAIALRRMDVLATRLLTVMFAGFQVLIWLPALAAKPHTQTLWAANAENLAIVASAWIVSHSLNSFRQPVEAPRTRPVKASY